MEASVRSEGSMEIVQPLLSAEFERDAAKTVVMRVKKRSGVMVPVDVMKIVERVELCSRGLEDVDPLKVATKAISGLYDGATTRELDELCIQTASLLISEEPNYSRLASRLLALYLQDEVEAQGIHSFMDSLRKGFEFGLVAESTLRFVEKNKAVILSAMREERNQLFEYFGLRTVADRYLLKHPESRLPIETPQFFLMRVSCGLSNHAEEAVVFYNMLSQLEYLVSTPTLFNSGTNHPQMSSCYLLDSPEDDLRSIYDRYKDMALLSKFAGGIGVSFSRVRSRGSLIKGTNGRSNGIIPWLKTLDSSVAAVNQGGKRKGAACVYLETWHADVEEFLELRDNTGDEAKRTHNLNFAHWVPDLFMKRVREDRPWSLFDPKDVPHLVDLFGEEFEEAYERSEREGKAKSVLPARELYARMMRTLAQTGNGWMTFKDHANRKSNQTKKGGDPRRVIHLSNLCTEILEVTSGQETAVCNLGSLNLPTYVAGNHFDFEKLGANVKKALVFLDRVVDLNFYPIESASQSNLKWRPVGLGVMGLQDVFFKLRLPFDSAEAKKLSREIAETIYYYALEASVELAEKHGPYEFFSDSPASQGILQPDLWGVAPSTRHDWKGLKEKIKLHGLRNSLVIAIAPTATIASIVGSYESIEPQVSNLFKRETLSGEFLQINRYLVKELKDRDLWNEETRNLIKLGEGSIQHIPSIPADVKEIYRTVWEIPMKSLIDMAAERGAFVDQSTSLNLFLESPTIGKLSSMYMYAWEKGIKTTYYLRSRPATTILKTTISSNAVGIQSLKEDEGSGFSKQVNNTGSHETTRKAIPSAASKIGYEEVVGCSLENPESCEACQ